MTTIHRINLGITKCYLLEYNNNFLLIDTSYSKKYRLLKRKLAQLKIDLNQIKFVFLTHHHDDHAGFLAELLRETNVTVILHREAISGLQAGKHDLGPKPVNACIGFLLFFFSLFRKHTFPSVNISDFKHFIIDDDDSSLLKKITGIDGKILHTPGHTPDSISLVLKSGEAFVGDAAMNFLNFCKIRYRPIFVNSIENVLNSWKKILEDSPQIIYPAHGAQFLADELEQSRKLWKTKHS